MNIGYGDYRIMESLRDGATVIRGSHSNWTLVDNGLVQRIPLFTGKRQNEGLLKITTMGLAYLKANKCPAFPRSKRHDDRPLFQDGDGI